MTFAVVVRSSNGQFQAALIGAPDVSATASTREQALAALESAIVQRLDQGELVALEVRRRGLEPARTEKIQTFFQELMDEGARIEEPWDVKQWFTKLDLAMRPFLSEEEMETFWNSFAKIKQVITLDDRDRCLTWLKAIRLKHCD